MKLPVLKIGKLVAEVPIIQGGMAIRLSTARLAAAVAKEGGIGLIAASGMSFDELRTEIRLARKLTGGKGIIGINAMFAAREFLGLITTAAQEKIDLIVAGAGFSRDIFAVGRKYGVEVVPIVSSVRSWELLLSLSKAPKQAVTWEPSNLLKRYFRRLLNPLIYLLLLPAALSAAVMLPSF